MGRTSPNNTLAQIACGLWLIAMPLIIAALVTAVNVQSDIYQYKTEPLVGAWTIRFPVDFSPNPNISYGAIQFFADGSLNGGDTTGLGGPSGTPIRFLQSPLAGQWRKNTTLPYTYDIFFSNVAVVRDTGNIVGRSRYNGTVTVDPTGSTFTAVFYSGALYNPEDSCIQGTPISPLPPTPTTGCKIKF